MWGPCPECFSFTKSLLLQNDGWEGPGGELRGCDPGGERGQARPAGGSEVRVPEKGGVRSTVSTRVQAHWGPGGQLQGHGDNRGTHGAGTPGTVREVAG